jgi:uncharacterized protein DUF6719
MTSFRAMCACALFALATLSPARADTVGREQDIVDLRLGQRVIVDDGTCPAGQVKEVRGAKMTGTGITRTRTCVPRFGPKSK